MSYLTALPCIVAATIFAMIGGARAAESDSLTTYELAPIIVTAPRVVSPLLNVPAAISVVGGDDIRAGRPEVAFDEALGRVPGLFAQNRYNFAQDLRLSIRGFGNRAAFGIRGIKILVDGIPETMPDGQSQVDAIDVSAADRIEVMRGPVSALYGNASGGVISIATAQGPPQPFVSIRATGGEYGLRRAQFSTGGNPGLLNFFVNYSYLEQDGYRDQSATITDALFTAKLRADLGDESSLTAIVSTLDSPLAEDPGGLTRDQVNDNRRQAAPLNIRFKTGESVTQQRAALVWDHASTSGDVQVTAYYGKRDFVGSIPFRIVTFDRDFGGGGAKYELRHGAGATRNRLLAGVDAQYQRDQRSNFDNDAGQPGGQTLLAQSERVAGIGPYLQDELTLFSRFTTLFGVRYDRIDFDIDDLLLIDGSGTRTFDQVTGRIGVSVAAAQALHLYGNVAQAFETPTTTEMRNPVSGLNPDIGAQRSINFELGAKGHARRVSYQLAAFRILLQDELLPFEDASGRTFFRNAGESRRNGIEASVDVTLTGGLRMSAAYTYLDAYFTDFVKIENGTPTNLAGNKLPGLPPHQLFLELFYRHSQGVFAGIDGAYVDGFFVDDENTKRNDAYTVFNLRLGYDDGPDGFLLSPFIGVQNLTNELYNSNTRINAFGGRYYEPAPERAVYAGVTMALAYSSKGVE